MSVDELLTKNFSKFSIDEQLTIDYSKMTIDELCERVYCDGMRTYNIDMFIHQLYWEEVNEIRLHKIHQYDIIRMLKKLNDEEINRLLMLERHYDFRTYLNGTQALMSAILVNSQFILYNYLLNRTKNINIKIDTLIIFFKLININFDSIPKQEIESIKSILKTLKTNFSKFDIFTNKWWSKFINKYDDCLSIARTKDWFSYPINFNKMIHNYGMDFFEDYLKDTGANYNEFCNWEYCPEFNSYTNNVDMKFIYFIQTFYL